MSSEDSGWEKILQDKIQSVMSSPDSDSSQIPVETPFMVDLSAHHLHDQVLNEVRQTFEASVVADHIIKHLFPQAEPFNYEQPAIEISHSFDDANPTVEGFQASGIYQPDNVPDENSNSFLDSNQSMPDFGNTPSDSSYESQQQMFVDPVPMDVQLPSEPYHSIPREEHDHMQVTQNLIISNISQSFDAFERERGLELALANDEDGLGFRLSQDIQSHLPSDGDNGEF